MSEKLLSNFWSQCPEVTLQLNIGTIVMGVFLKNHKSEQLPFLFDFQENLSDRALARPAPLIGEPSVGSLPAMCVLERSDPLKN